jgi:hypothetical protein
MAVTGTEIKIGVDILSRIFKSFKGVLETKKEKDIISKVYRELLLGDKGDLDKVEAMLLQVEKHGALNPDYVKVKGYFINAGAMTGISAKKIVKKRLQKS